MARKRKALKKINYESPEYWNRLLAEDELSMEQGNSPRLIYVGSSQELESLEGFLQTDDGSTPQSGGSE